MTWRSVESKLITTSGNLETRYMYILFETTIVKMTIFSYSKYYQYIFFHLEFWWGIRKLQKLYISELCTNLSAQSICLLCPKQNSKLLVVYLATIGLKISSSNSFTAILGASSLLPRIKFIFYNYKRKF